MTDSVKGAGMFVHLRTDTAERRVYEAVSAGYDDQTRATDPNTPHELSQRERTEAAGTASVWIYI